MVDAAGVAVAYGGDELVEVSATEVFAEATFGDLREEFAPLGEVHDEVDF